SYGPGNNQSSEEIAKHVGKKVVSKTAGSLLGPAALPIGAGLKFASEG
ncbi:5429_t:CDS:1, partial [Funneliformis geosporum]